MELAEITISSVQAGWGSGAQNTTKGDQVALRGTKAISCNMWETGQGKLLSYSTLGNTWVLGIISHNHPSGLSPDMPQVPDLGKETRALCPS